MNNTRQYQTRTEREVARAALAARIDASGYPRAILHGLQSKSVYQGTAKDEAFGRRVKNRAAAASRRINRRRSA